LSEIEWLKGDEEYEKVVVENDKEVQLPDWGEGNDRQILVQETAKEDSLKYWRELADRKLRGYNRKEEVWHGR